MHEAANAASGTPSTSELESSATSLSYPLNTVIASLDASNLESAVAALTSAGFARDEIDVITPADVGQIDSPLDATGPQGFVQRVILSFGIDMDFLEHLRGQVHSGRVLVAVPADGDDEKARAAAVLKNHGAHSLSYVGRWTIERLG